MAGRAAKKPAHLASENLATVRPARPRNDQNVILPTIWMLRGWVTVPFQVPKVALEGSLLNGMQSPNASPSHVK
jgi:hypothetical protein